MTIKQFTAYLSDIVHCNDTRYDPITLKTTAKFRTKGAGAYTAVLGIILTSKEFLNLFFLARSCYVPYQLEDATKKVKVVS